MIRAIRKRYLARSEPGIRDHDAVGAAGGLHRAVDVVLVGLGDLGEHLLGGRVDGLERLAVPVDELAVDEQAVGRLDVDDRARLGGGAYSNFGPGDAMGQSTVT